MKVNLNILHLDNQKILPNPTNYPDIQTTKTKGLDFQYFILQRALKIKVKNLFADANKDKNLDNPDMVETYGQRLKPSQQSFNATE